MNIDYDKENNIYNKINNLYKKIYNLLKNKPLKDFNLSELNVFKTYFEELILLLAISNNLGSNIKFTYVYTGTIKRTKNYELVYAYYENKLKIDLDAIISLQDKLIKHEDYDIDVFISLVLINAAVHEITHLKQRRNIKRGSITLENYLLSKELCCDSICLAENENRFLNYYQRLNEAKAHKEGIKFVLNFLNITKRRKIEKKVLKHWWTYNHLFTYYYSQFPYSHNNGELISNEIKGNEIVRSFIKNSSQNIYYILSQYPILRIEINEFGDLHTPIELIDLYFEQNEEKNKEELLKIYYYILIPKLDNDKLDDMILELVKKYGKSRISTIFNELYSLSERISEKATHNFEMLLKIMDNPNFEISNLYDNVDEFDRNTLNKKHQALLLDVFTKQIIISKVINAINRIHNKEVVKKGD